MNNISKSNINENAWKMSNGDQFIQNWKAWSMSNMTPAYNNNNKYLDTEDRNKTALDYSDLGTTLGGTFGNIFGPLGGIAGAAAGNLIGQGVNYIANKNLQENQLNNQKELQNRAFSLNQQAVLNQAEAEKIGMQNAGLNPAAVNGQGAPSLQAGAAAGANSTMSNIFGGLAELINAIKAPTEIEKMQAEKALTEAGTEKTYSESDLLHEQKYNIMLNSDLIKPAEAEQLHQLAQKHIAEASNLTTNADYTNNLSRILENQDNFIQKYSASIYSTYRDQLKSTKQWDSLSKNTRDTIDKLASGEIDIGMGELEGLNKIINSSTNLLDADKNQLEDMLHSIITRRQINNKTVLKDFEELPINQRKLMASEITNFYAQAKQAKTSADKINTDKWITEHTNDEWLIEHGLTDEIERRKYKDVFNNLLKLTDPSTYSNVIGSGLIGRGLSRGTNGKLKHNGPFYTAGLGDYQSTQWTKNH